MNIMMDEFSEGMVVVPEKVLLKLFVRRYQVPDGIPERGHSDQRIEDRRTQEGDELGIRKGLVRAGIWDTGKPVNFKLLSVFPVIADLDLAGYQLADVVWHWKRDEQKELGRGGQVAVLLQFVPPDPERKPVNLTGKAQAWLQRRLQAVYKEVAVWYNPNRVITINCRAVAEDQSDLSLRLLQDFRFEALPSR